MVTLKHIARELDLDISTVSQVLHRGDQRYSQTTRERIHSTAQRLGYRANALARSMRRGRTFSIGVFGHNLAITMTMEKVQVISSELHALGYKMFLAGGEESDIALEREIVEDLLARRVEGLIINTEPDADPTYYEDLQKRGVPLVLLGMMLDARRLPLVSVDIEGGMCAAIKHLLDLGHRDIAFAMGSYAIRTNVGRWPAITRTMQEAGIPLRMEWVLHDVPSTPEENNAFTRRIMSSTGGAVRPTAICYANDELAMGGMHVLRELGLEIPRDVSVVGFDDLPVAKLAWPALTTVRQPRAELAKAAVGLLLEQIDEKRPSSHQVTLKTELIVRQSTATANSPQRESMQ